MPFYDYRCSQCEKITERTYTMSEKKPVVIKCSYCGCHAANRQYTHIGFTCPAATGGQKTVMSIMDNEKPKKKKGTTVCIM